MWPMSCLLIRRTSGDLRLGTDPSEITPSWPAQVGVFLPPSPPVHQRRLQAFETKLSTYSNAVTYYFVEFNPRIVCLAFWSLPQQRLCRILSPPTQPSLHFLFLPLVLGDRQSRFNLRTPLFLHNCKQNSFFLPSLVTEWLFLFLKRSKRKEARHFSRSPLTVVFFFFVSSAFDQRRRSPRHTQKAQRHSLLGLKMAPAERVNRVINCLSIHCWRSSVLSRDTLFSLSLFLPPSLSLFFSPFSVCLKPFQRSIFLCHSVLSTPLSLFLCLSCFFPSLCICFYSALPSPFSSLPFLLLLKESK